MVDYAIIESECVNVKTKDNVVNLAIQTIEELSKQVLVFNNSKRSSESTAEKIAFSISKIENKDKLQKLSQMILKSLSSPTKQCRKLANCVEKGVAFHHAGLAAKQREIVEKGFKQGLIKVISSTPTLAAGLNLPAYKVIIKDYKRYSQRGMADIPILEYHQMAGRAGRPGKEDIGKTVLCVSTEDESKRIIPKYIFGKPEEILSKLAVEPTLKMYVLSLISMNMINTKEEIKNFFANTLYAKQFQDIISLNKNIFRIIEILKSYNFIEQEDDYYMATQIGRKISELYLNPDTANFFLEHIDYFFKKFSDSNISKNDIYSLIQFLSTTIEMRPLFRVSKIEQEFYFQKSEEINSILAIEYDPFEVDLEEHLASIKTTEILIDWINEAPEDYIMEKYKVTPGELNYKCDVIDWLLYSIEEISTMKKNFFFRNQINKLRTRFKYGIKNELIPLISIKGIGRVRARNLYKKEVKTLDDLKTSSFEKLSSIIGESLTIKIKEELSSGFQDINTLIDKKPNEIKAREVSTDEVEELVINYDTFEKEKKEFQSKLTDFF